MENIECKNCGSTEFKTDSEIIVCLYCETPYFEEKNITKKVVVQEKLSNKAILLSIFGVALLFLIGLFSFSSIKNQRVIEVQKLSPDSELSQEEYGYKYIRDAGGWTTEIYDDIKIAKGEMNAHGKWVNYRDGSLYNDVVQQVGEPSSLHEDTSDNTITAIWKQNETSNHIVWVNIIYEKSNSMIIEKSVRGWDL